MQTETLYDPTERITSISFQPEQYDAFPQATKAWVDGRVIRLHRNREALCHALLLFPFISGRLCPKLGCGVDVAESLRELFLPRNVVIDHVALSSGQTPVGTRTAVLCDGSYRSAATLHALKSDVVFRLNESAYTSAIGPRNVTISSNFGLFARRPGQLHTIIPMIAAAVMFSEDLGISRLVLPIHDLTFVEAELLRRLTNTLAAVNISTLTPLLAVDFAALAHMLPRAPALETYLAERHEHSRSPEDLPDFWMANLLSARATNAYATADQAIARLREFSRAGHPFSPQEANLVWPQSWNEPNGLKTSL